MLRRPPSFARSFHPTHCDAAPVPPCVRGHARRAAAHRVTGPPGARRRGGAISSAIRARCARSARPCSRRSSARRASPLRCGRSSSGSPATARERSWCMATARRSWSASGPTPATRWAAQLAALDVAARRAHARPFAATHPGAASRARAVGARRAQGWTASRRSAVPRTSRSRCSRTSTAAPRRRTSATTRAIMRQHCRPLAASTRKPLPLAGVRRA